MFVLEGRMTSNSRWLALGQHKTKADVTKQLRNYQGTGSPTHTWEFRRLTVCSGHQVAVQYYARPKDLEADSEKKVILETANRLKKQDKLHMFPAIERHALALERPTSILDAYPNMARLAPEVEAMAQKEGW